MPSLSFTANLRRHFDCPAREVDGFSVREVIDGYFGTDFRSRSYLLDDQGAVREHVVIFLDGEPIRDRARQSDPVRPNSEIYVMQALSGG
jgi:sulfur carrier protein ThiS